MPHPPLLTWPRRTLLGALAAAPFTRPAYAAGAVSFLIQADKIFAPVSVNGVAVDAILDSGSTISTLDAGFANSLSLRTRGRFSGRGVSGRVSGAWTTGVSFEIAGQALRPARVGVIDYSALSRQLGRPVQAVLGRDLFDAFVTDLDFAARTLALHRREGFVPAAGARLVALTAQGGRLTAPISVEGGAPIQALVDLGNDLPLILSPGPDSRKLLRDRPTSTALIGGYGSAAVGQVATARDVAFAGAQIAAVPVTVAPRSIGFAANLGLPLLRRFRLQLDFAGARMWLTPQAGAPAFYKDLTGLNGFVDGEVLRILHVARGGPAERAGFKAGDLVAAIDGQPASLANASLAEAAKGRTLDFTLTNGAHRRLVLAEYY